MPKKRTLVFFLTSLFIYSGCQPVKNLLKKPQPKEFPQVQREFRAAWVATVANINWPSAPGLPVEQQQEEAIQLLDLLQRNNFNAVIFQVRPQADALYKSTLEPWSYYLTGEQGVAPDPYYDPLSFWIEEAHKRNLELHVWLNPYRAHHTTGGLISESSVVNTKSELVKELDSGYWWFDPSLKATQDHSHAVVMDIVKRYDIDGVHFDDYFYPYPSYHNGDFPDDESWEAYQKSGGKLSRGDWRRKAVDDFIERVYRSIKEEKPYVRFGISPFGIWRPGHPNSIEGFDQYEELYADAKKWLNEGWVDYFTPQLYWPVNQVPQSFPVLLNWWDEQNYKDRDVWPGMSIGRFQGNQQIDEVLNQIMITRGITPKSPGTVHWSIEPLVGNDSLQQALQNTVYAEQAVVPPMDWLSNRVPKKPEVNSTLSTNYLEVSIQKKPEEIDHWTIYAKYGNRWKIRKVNKFTDHFKVTAYIPVSPSTEESPLFQKVHILDEVFVTYQNRYGLESEATKITF